MNHMNITITARDDVLYHDPFSGTDPGMPVTMYTAKYIGARWNTLAAHLRKTYPGIEIFAQASGKVSGYLPRTTA